MLEVSTSLLALVEQVAEKVFDESLICLDDFSRHPGPLQGG